MTSQADAQHDKLSAGLLYGSLAALIWGAWPVVSRFGVQQSLTPYDITALRFGVAGLLLLPLIWRRGLGGVGWIGALVLAAGAGVPYVLVTVGGLALAPAGHAGVIVPSCMLTFSALGSWLFLGDRPDRTRLLGLAVIIGGVLMIGWQGLSGSGAEVWTGDLMFVAGGLFWAIYTVGSRYWSVDPLHATALVSVLGLQDLVYNSFTAGRSTRELFTFMFVALIIYLILTAVSDVGLRWLDRKYSVGVRRA